MAKRKLPRSAAKRRVKTSRTPAARAARPKARRAAKPAAKKATGESAGSETKISARQAASAPPRARKATRPATTKHPKSAPAAKAPRALKKKAAARTPQPPKKQGRAKSVGKAAASPAGPARSRRSDTARIRPRVQPPGIGVSPEELAALVPGTISSLDLNQRALEDAPVDDLAAAFRTSGGTDRAIVAGDVDVPVLGAATSGEEAPGGDNPTPDQDVVDLIGRSLGVEYADNEELRPADKIADRDKHRWELDPASAEDYRDRTKPG